jgi:hypothetical protein
MRGRHLPRLGSIRLTSILTGLEYHRNKFVNDFVTVGKKFNSKFNIAL